MRTSASTPPAVDCRHADAAYTDVFQTLLDLGASPNYKDARGLTPLYYTVVQATNALCTEALLHDHATIGCADDRGWTEVHHVSSLVSNC